MKTISVLIRWLLHCIKHQQFRVRIISKEFNKPVAILANGPSLNEALDSLKSCHNEVDFCMVNFAPLSPAFFELKPKYLVMYDGGFFNNNSRLQDKIEQQTDAIKNADWNLCIITSLSYKKQAVDRFKNQSNITIVSLFDYNIPNLFKNNRIRFQMYNRGYACPVMNNVVQAGIFSMILLGYKTIFLYGVEHSFVSNLVVDDNNVLCVKDTHYYDKGEAPLVPLKINGKPERLHEQLYNLYDTFYSYILINEYAESRNVLVINKTKGSYIDAFRKEI